LKAVCSGLGVTPDKLIPAIKKVLIKTNNGRFAEKTDNGSSVFDGIKSKFRKKSSYNDENDTEGYEELEKEEYIENKPKMFSESEMEQIKNDAIEDLQNDVLNHTAENCKDRDDCQICEKFFNEYDDDTDDDGNPFSKVIG